MSKAHIEIKLALLLTALSIFGMVSCSSITKDHPDEPEKSFPINTITASFSENTTTSPSSEGEKPMVGITVLPEINPPNKITPSITIQALPTAQTPIVVVPCEEAHPYSGNEMGQFEGLVLSGEWDEGYGTGVMDESGLENPAMLKRFDPANEVLVLPVSGKWLVLRTIKTINWEKDIYSLELQVTDFTNQYATKVNHNNIELSRFDEENWINESEIIIPIKIREDLFEWIIWSPFEGKEEKMSAELPGYGESFSRYHVPPKIDPRTELVVYPCETCEEAEYLVKSVISDTVEWKMDLGPDPDDSYRSEPVWSPNGEFVAVVGEANGNGDEIFIFKRNGKLIHQASSLNLGYWGIAADYGLIWSPDSNYLAFIRLKMVNDSWPPEQSIAYLDLLEGLVTDLCLESQGIPVWSPDSNKIAVRKQVEADKRPRMITVVDIKTKIMSQTIDPEAKRIVGWVNINDIVE